MKCNPAPIHLIAAAGMVVVPAFSARADIIAPAGAVGTQSAKPSLALVAGRPAIAWTDGAANTVRYVRALDAAGLSWGAPITIGSSFSIGLAVSLAVVNGRPAVVYAEAGYTAKFVRANDASGDSWGAPVPLNNTKDADQLHLTVIAGIPALMVRTGSQVKSTYAVDADGTAWYTAGELYSFSSTRAGSFAEVEGTPALVYLTASGITYTRATNPEGSTWTALSTVVSGSSMTACSLHVAGGNPAVCYYQGSNLKYVRATGSTGGAWGAPVTLNVIGDGGVRRSEPSVALIGGKPAVAFVSHGTNSSLRYIEAKDNTGGTGTWNASAAIESRGNTGDFPSLLEVDGRPAVAFVDASSATLNYLRATESNGETQWPAQLRVKTDTGLDIPPGGTVEFGVAAVGSAKRLPLTLLNANAGTPAIQISGLSLDGPDAAEFSIVSAPPGTPLSAGSSSGLVLEYAPVVPGFKTATLHIQNNAGNAPNSWDIILTADSRPDISVERPAGNPLTDGGKHLLPVTAAGFTGDITLLLRNPGGGELNGLAVTLDGPDRAEFSVVPPLPGPLPPGALVPLTLRHVQATPGVKTVNVHIASNVTGAKNPFDIIVSKVPGLPDECFNFNGFSSSRSVITGPGGRIFVSGFSAPLLTCHADGTPDTSFFPPTVGGGGVECLAMQPDGRILVAGSFMEIGGRPRGRLARLFPDGTPDESFTFALTSPVLCLALLPDGRILAGSPANGITRLTAAGAGDSSLAAQSVDGEIRCIAPLPDGKILIGGGFSKVNGVTARGIARLNNNGTLDLEFSSGLPQLSAVNHIALTANGRIMAAGSFSGGVARLFPNGVPDFSYTAFINRWVEDIALQADGSCLVAGSTHLGGLPFHNELVRLLPNGTFDPAFDPLITLLSVNNVTLQPNGEVLFAGDTGALAASLLRLKNDPALSRLENAGSSAIRWLRGGSAPEVRDVTFDAKPSGAAGWTRLGSAARIPSGWELSGLTLPASGTLRAQAYAGNSVIEQTAPVLTPFESWRLQYFNTPDNTGPAADDADPDHDGLANFTEFAFGLSPVDRGSNTIPEFRYDGTAFTAAFTPPDGRDDLLYGAEWSPSLLPGAWTAIPDSGAGQSHVFSAPGGEGRVFVRFVVTMR